ncbi:hypothetical protein [Ureibacillus sp. FSL W8-0352]
MFHQEKYVYHRIQDVSGGNPMRMILSDVQMRQLVKIIGMSNMCPDVLHI